MQLRLSTQHCPSIVPALPQDVTDPGVGVEAQIDYGVRTINELTGRKIQEFLASGAILNELKVDWQPPLVEVKDGLIIVHERMRVL